MVASRNLVYTEHLAELLVLYLQALNFGFPVDHPIVIVNQS